MIGIPVAIEDSVRRVPIEMAMQELGWRQDKDFYDLHTATWVHPDHPDKRFMLSEACCQELKQTRKELLERRAQAKRLHTYAVILAWLSVVLLLGIDFYLSCCR